MKAMLVTVALVAATGFAQEAEVAEDAAVATNAPASRATTFMTLPLCRLVEGDVQACTAGDTWGVAEEGRYYPLGTSFRTGADGRLVLVLGQESRVTIGANSSFATRLQPLGQQTRTIILLGGTVNLDLADNLPPGAFTVTAPGFTAKDLAGESRFSVENKGDGDEVRVRCITGAIALDGRHFDIPAMHSADEVVIRTSHDHLSTLLYGTSGDYVVRLDQGMRVREDIGDDGAVKRVEEKATFEWRLSPKTKVIINRAVPAIGERMSVHTMAFDAAGERKSECAFCEGRVEVNSGEMVPREALDGETLVKRAAEATETTEASDAEETSAEGEKSDDSSSDKKEE